MHKSFRLERRLHYGSKHAAESRSGLKRVISEPDWGCVAAQVTQAEQLGFDALVSAENPMDPYLAIAIASQVPSRIRLVTGIAVALSRSPVSTAYTAWELQRMSGGRFVLGLGSQVKAHISRRFAMPWSAPAERMREYIEVVKACWRNWQTGEPLDYQGDIYHVDLMTPPVQLPAQSNAVVPIQLAAVGEQMLRVAGQVAQGVRLHDFCSPRFVSEVALPNLRAGFALSGRDAAEWDDFEIAGGGLVATARTEDGLRREIDEVRKRLALYASTPAYRAQMEIEGFADEAELLTKLSKEKRWGEMPFVLTDEMVYRFAAVGKHDVIVDRIREHFRDVTTLQLSMPFGDETSPGLVGELVTDLKKPHPSG